MRHKIFPLSLSEKFIGGENQFAVCSSYIISYIFYLLSFTYSIYYNLFIIWEL